MTIHHMALIQACKLEMFCALLFTCSSKIAHNFKLTKC
jgi:hypothetical protein